MKDKAGHSGTKAGHVPNCPSDKAGQDGTSLLKDVRMSRLSGRMWVLCFLAGFVLDDIKELAWRCANIPSPERNQIEGGGSDED